MFIPLKMVLIGIDPYPYLDICFDRAWLKIPGKSDPSPWPAAAAQIFPALETLWRRGRGRPSPPWHVEQRSAIYRENNGWNHGFYMFLPRNRGVQWILVNYSTSFRTCQNVDEEGTSEINRLMLQKICTNLFHHIMGTSKDSSMLEPTSTCLTCIYYFTFPIK